MRASAHISCKADNPHKKAFDRELVDAGINLDRCEVPIVRKQNDALPDALKSFDRNLAINAGNDNLAIGSLGRPVHCDKVAVQNSRVPHAHPTDSEKEIWSRPEEVAIYRNLSLEVRVGTDRLARCDSAYERENQDLIVRQRWLGAADPALVEIRPHYGRPTLGNSHRDSRFAIRAISGLPTSSRPTPAVSLTLHNCELDLCAIIKSSTGTCWLATQSSDDSAKDRSRTAQRRTHPMDTEVRCCLAPSTTVDPGAHMP